MFEATGSITAPVSVQMSFWQCFKAGFAFAAGASLVALVGWFVTLALYPIYVRAWMRVWFGV